MPYIHPDLHVPCMTQAEFWNSVAVSEGKKTEEVIENYYGEIADEEDRARKELMENRSEVMRMLLEYYDPKYGDLDWVPTNLVEVVDATVRFSAKKSMTTVKAIINCSDARTRLVEYSECNWSGSYLDPPDFECNCIVLEEYPL